MDYAFDNPFIYSSSDYEKGSHHPHRIGKLWIIFIKVLIVSLASWMSKIMFDLETICLPAHVTAIYIL